MGQWKLNQEFRKNISIFLLIGVFFSSLVWVGIYTRTKIEFQSKASVRSALQTVLRTTHEAMCLWFEHRKHTLTTVTNDDRFLKTTEELLSLPENTEVLKKSSAQKKLREMFEPKLREFRDLGYFIINRNFVNLASWRDSNIGLRNLIAEQHLDVLEKVFQGKVLFVPTIASDVTLLNESGRSIEKVPMFFIAGPVKNAGGEVIAALALRLDPKRDFTYITQLGRIGNSGETYAFDENGMMITESRFDMQLRNIGLIKPNEGTLLNIRIADPGGNLVEGYRSLGKADERPLTAMAKDAVAGNSGFNTDGYRDYRGVDVFGAWIWDKNLGFGMTTEIDAKEALQSFYATRFVVITGFAATGTIAFILILVIIMIKKKNEKDLRDINNSLEERVLRRTKDLEKIRTELSLANRELENLATQDALTGLANRRNLDAFIEKEWKRCLRREKSLSFAMLDLDFFKIYNDTYGHQAGDECLKEIGRILSENRFASRPGDLIARYGGEEFALVLGETELEDAINILEKILLAIRQAKIPHINSKIQDVDIVTVSIGVSCVVPQREACINELIQRADEALYQAKGHGRNRIEVCSQEMW